MKEISKKNSVQHAALRSPPPAFHPPVQDATKIAEELLPFTVRLVDDEGGLQKAIALRHAAYARHLPEFAETLKSAEAADSEEGVVILLAESKVDGAPLGTMRIHCNSAKPLPLESSVKLPQWMFGARLAEATRLAVTRDRAGQLVKTVLFKAYFQYCQTHGIEWLVITGRAPIDRQYDRLMFTDVFPELGYIPLEHVGNLPHRVMYFHVNTAKQLWSLAKHPLYDFIFNTNHSDTNLEKPSINFWK
jgi:GNAT superfamily N-acetyltransferase